MVAPAYNGKEDSQERHARELDDAALELIDLKVMQRWNYGNN